MDGIAVRDLAQFHLRWPEFRGEMEAMVADGRITARRREIVKWLVRLADRVGGRDLE
jgi:hypothetical protein